MNNLRKKNKKQTPHRPSQAVPPSGSLSPSSGGYPLAASESKLALLGDEAESLALCAPVPWDGEKSFFFFFFFFFPGGLFFKGFSRVLYGFLFFGFKGFLVVVLRFL